jgi:4-hydroxythreonine-4-phosphate dehydrogenase
VLIPFKYINTGKGVNFSAGLPIVRTSPDHGVAYDIAGKGFADESSMIEAYQYAKLIIMNRKRRSLIDEG